MTTPNKQADKPATKKSGRKAGQPAKVWDYTGLDAAVLGAPSEVTAQLASLAAPMRARDERQVAVDQVVSSLYQEYVTGGKQERWAQAPKRSYHVAPEAADTVRMLVRRAAQFLGYSVKFGSGVRDKDGREIVVFAVRDQRVKADKAKDSWSLAELRAFALDFFGDEGEAAEFEASLLGEGPEDESDEEGNEEDSETATVDGSGSPDPALRAVDSNHT